MATWIKKKKKKAQSNGELNSPSTSNVEHLTQNYLT